MNQGKLINASLTVNGEKMPSFAFAEGSSAVFDFESSRRLGIFSPHIEVVNDSDGKVKKYPCPWIKMKNGKDFWRADVDINEAGLYFLRFIYKTPFGEQVETYNVTVFKRGYETPDWIKGGIMYQIFCDRFARSENHPYKLKEGTELYEDWENGIPQFNEKPGDPLKNNCFFGGTLYGIIEKLDYLQSLGVTTLYLNPIFDAASNHKYDTGDYLKVDDAFGGDEALDELISELKKRNMHVVLDGVFNHTGDDSVYFNRYGNYNSVGAYQSKESPYYDWYDFKDYPDRYTCWWDVKILPCIKKNSDSFREFICGKEGVAAHYLKKGIDGWRLDVADELSNEFLKQLRQTSHDINPSAYIIGEVWEDASDKIAYDHRRSYFQGEQLDAVMNYPTRTAIIDYVLSGNAEKIAGETALLYRNYPKAVSDALMNLLGTHDTERILNTLSLDGSLDMTNRQLSTYRMPLAKRKEAIERVKLAAFLCYTLPGYPCIYYGDEIGMEGGRDPFNRMPFAYSKADKSLLSFYRKLGAIRSSISCFKDGEYKVLMAKDGLFLFKRGKTLCAVNLGASKIFVSDMPFFEAFSGDNCVPCDDGRFRYSLGKGKFAIFTYNE